MLEKIITVDSAKQLVLDYGSKTGPLSVYLNTAVAEIKNIFGKLPLDVNKFGNQIV